LFSQTGIIGKSTEEEYGKYDITKIDIVDKRSSPTEKLKY